MRLPWLQNARHWVRSRRGLWQDSSYKLRELLRVVVSKWTPSGQLRPLYPPNGGRRKAETTKSLVQGVSGAHLPGSRSSAKKLKDRVAILAEPKSG